MARPAIIIGLGGTGAWVLTWLKKELLEIGEGVMPEEVKLVCFDTTSEPAAYIGGADADKRDIKLGNVQLEPNTEFFWYGDNLHGLVQQIGNGLHEHLQWLPAQSFLAKFPPSTFRTVKGAGAVRHLGRLSLFNDINKPNSVIMDRLFRAMQDVNIGITEQRQVEVIVVGSTAGGTGAGILIDMAMLIRKLAADAALQYYQLRGFFVLPNAFTKGVPDRKKYAQTFAAWRELDRFKIVSREYGIPEVVYDPNNFVLAASERPYDVTYLVDPNRPQNSLAGIEPEEGLYPALAASIGTLLDTRAGNDYTEFVTVNYPQALAQMPDYHPYHSAVGTYTIRVPAYYSQSSYSHQLALELLKELLAVKIDAKTKRAIDLDFTRNLEKNQGDWSAIPFLSGSGLTIGSDTVPNTLYLPLVASVYEYRAADDGNIINQVAIGGMTSGNESRFLSGLIDIAPGIKDAEAEKLLARISDEVHFRIFHDPECLPSKDYGDLPEEASRRLNNSIPRVRAEHYGMDNIAGRQLRGKFGESLEQARDFQIERFRLLLASKLAQELNGTHHDVIASRTGKLGWTRKWLDHMIEVFSYFETFMSKVRDHRNESLKLSIGARQATQNAKEEYHNWMNKQSFVHPPTFIHVYAWTTQGDYLEAEQREIDIRKDDILLDVLTETNAAMKKIAESARAEIESWTQHLAIGDPSRANKVPGLYNLLLNSLDGVESNHQREERLKTIVEMVGTKKYDLQEQHLKEALERITWDVECTADGVEVMCQFTVGGDEYNQPYVYQLSRDVAGEHNAGQVNLFWLLELASTKYKAMSSQQSVVHELYTAGRLAANLADDINGRAEPMYRPAQPVIKGKEFGAHYIRVRTENVPQAANAQAYITQFEDRLWAIAPAKNMKNKRCESENAHTLIVFRSDDLMRSEDFNLWHECRDAYLETVTSNTIPAAELHVFPAEINACYYEMMLQSVLRKPYRILKPKVVALMDHAQHFEWFFRCYALGFIKYYEGDTSMNYPDEWVFQLPNMNEGIYLNNPTLDRGGIIQKTKVHPIFKVIDAFVYKQVDQRPGSATFWIDWDETKQAIVQAQRSTDDSGISKYQDAINNGIVKTLRDFVTSERAMVQQKDKREFIREEEQDLADVAEIIYRNTINVLQAQQKQKAQKSNPQTLTEQQQEEEQ